MSCDSCTLQNVSPSCIIMFSISFASKVSLELTHNWQKFGKLFVVRYQFWHIIILNLENFYRQTFRMKKIKLFLPVPGSLTNSSPAPIAVFLIFSIRSWSSDKVLSYENKSCRWIKLNFCSKERHTVTEFINFNYMYLKYCTWVL